MLIARCLQPYLLSLCSVAVISLTAVSASAQTTPRATTADNERQARVLYAQGQQAFMQEDYGTAAARFEAAYALSPNAVLLLYNLGLTYDRLQMPQQAHDAYEHYLQVAPNAPERAEIEARLRVMRADAEMARERQEAIDSPTRIVSERVVYREVQVPQEPRNWRTASIVFGSLTGVGVAVTVSVSLLAQRYFQMLRQDCGDLGHQTDPSSPWCSRVQVDDIQLRATLTNAIMFTTIGVGIATAVTATIDATRRRPTRTTAVPSGTQAPTPAATAVQVAVVPEINGASFVVGGRF